MPNTLIPTPQELGISPKLLWWYRASFLLAVIYNTLWGTFVILFPRKPFELAHMPMPDETGILFWQCIGMFVLVYAIGYWYLYRDPIRYAPFLLVAVAGKIAGPAGWVWAWSMGKVPGYSGLTILTNDILWWPLWFTFVWQTVLRPNKAGNSAG
jgi:small multidrug resistance pump